MEPRKHTLAELFEGQLIYVVPNYQRLYVWNREDQWEPLWSDVEDIANFLANEASTRGSETVNPDSVEAHFLGAVVLKPSGSTPDLARQLRVIDGQQRLTTLQLLVAAAITELENICLFNPADRLRQLTVNSSGSNSSGNISFKISHHRHHRGHDYEQFGDVMDATLQRRSTESLDGPMAECYKFFREAIREWLSMQQEHLSAAVSALATTLIVKLHIVGIYLDPPEKEHIIFETLNARGEPLTEWDKIKNYLLYKADDDPDLDQEQFFETYLDRFDNPWWRKAVGRGAQKRPRTDIFADYWLESRMRTPVAVRRVYREFERHVDREEQRLESIMLALSQDARYFERFEETEPGNTSREAQFHSRRLDMAVGAIWPLLLYLQRKNAEQMEQDRWFAILESYFVRRMIVGYQARSYDHVALELLNVLATTNEKEDSIADVMLKHLMQFSEAGSLWPNDMEINQAVLQRNLPQKAQLLVLTAIEQHLTTNRAGKADLAPNVQIEHILPRGWQPESWPLPESIEPTLALTSREQIVETLGNLTLLNGRLNSSISNASWDVKRSAIQESDNLFLNRRLLKNSTNVWTEEDIHKRGNWMYSVMVKIWPRA